jgi:hypothetical protein
MSYILLLAVACFLTIVALRKKHSLKDEFRDNEVLYYFLKSSLEFLVPFTFVLLAYGGLLLVISTMWQSISLQSLIWLEDFLTTIHSYTKWKLSKLMVLGFFIGIYVLGFFGMRFEVRKRLYEGVESLYTWGKRIYVFFVLLCSFTLLGTQLGQPTDDLRLRIKLTRDGYAELRQQTKDALSEAVAVKLHSKTHDSFPPDYHAALKRPQEIGTQTKSLRAYYTKAQTELGVRSSKAESVLRQAEARTRSASDLQTEIQGAEETSDKRANVSNSEPGDVTYQKISEAKAAVQDYQQKTRGKLISFLTTEDGKRLTVQGAKIMTDVLKSRVVSSWIKLYPISEPLIDVFFKTLDETLKAKLEKLAADLTPSIVERPANFETAINDESTELASQTEIKTSPEMIGKAKQSGAQLEQEIAGIEAAKTEVFEALTVRLHSPSKSDRATAASHLSETPDISEAKVNRLIVIMRKGNQQWITSRYRIEGHHCTDYEYTSVRYYAATAVERIKSPYVNEELVREARRCQDKSVTTKTVTDPGWI